MPPANVWPVDANDPDPATIARAAALIRAGQLVAFPTETVYGLGANALDADAVARIFAVKGRPATNPVIVHVADEMQARTLTSDWTALAAKLATAFWPGPLTLVLRKRVEIPDTVTAGGETVALRCPNHAVALGLLKASGVPIAAPSANRSTELSPTRAEHVDLDVTVLDGGPCVGGIESTVVDVTGPTALILRPGLIDALMLAAVIGDVESGSGAGTARSPGMMERHYRPRVPLHLAGNETEAEEIVNAMSRRGLKARYLSELNGLTPALFASRLYALLHGVGNDEYCVVIVKPPVTLQWSAIQDRLRRAASPYTP